MSGETLSDYKKREHVTAPWEWGVGDDLGLHRGLSLYCTGWVYNKRVFCCVTKSLTVRVHNKKGKCLFTYILCLVLSSMCSCDNEIFHIVDQAL